MTLISSTVSNNIDNGVYNGGILILGHHWYIYYEE